MKTIQILVTMLLLYNTMQAQKTVQQLQPVRLSIFKNGTYFVKKEGTVNITNGSFIIPAPTNVLMGTYWLAAGKGSTLKSILVKEDTFRVEGKASSVADYLKANINSQVTIKPNWYAQDLQAITGTLLEYDDLTGTVKLKTADRKIIIAKINDANSILLPENAGSRFAHDSVTALARVNVDGNAGSTLASTFSLEKGIQWFPSYQLRVLNDKEARLEMKATIVSGDESFRNTAVDIIVGSPEMFFGKELDPVCVDYLNKQIFSNDNYQSNYLVNTVTQNRSVTYNWASLGTDEESDDQPDKNGSKLQDLYIYQLGTFDLEKNSKVIVPVLGATVSYEDIYTAEIPVADEKSKPLDVYHKYRIKNNGTAPLTAGAVLVINEKEMPMAQSLLKYTAVRGYVDINLSKAIDVPVKNEELEVKREPNAKKSGGDTYDRVTYSGKINIVNLQDKKIKIKVTKGIEGLPAEASSGGTIKKVKNEKNSINPYAVITWEIELEPGAGKELTYGYSSFAD